MLGKGLPSTTSDSVDQRWAQSEIRWLCIVDEHEDHLGSS